MEHAESRILEQPNITIGSTTESGQLIDAGPDHWWKRPAFVGRYVRNIVDGLQQKPHVARYSMQSMMALAQGIQYLCEQPQTLLDAGCGPGLRAAEMRMKFFPDAAIVGCDYSDPMLQRAEMIVSNLPESARVRIDKADVNELPYGDGFFDAVFSYGLLMSLPKPHGAISEILRVSKTGFVTIEETPAVMDESQACYWQDTKERKFPGRIYWHDYLECFAPYKTTIFSPIPVDAWEETTPPGYARFIVSK